MNFGPVGAGVHASVAPHMLAGKQVTGVNAKGAKGEKRPADVIGNAVHVMRIATSEIEEGAPINGGKDSATKALDRKGGAARAAKLGPEQRAEIARNAAAKRWATEEE